MAEKKITVKVPKLGNLVVSPFTPYPVIWLTPEMIGVFQNAEVLLANLMERKIPDNIEPVVKPGQV